MSVDYRLVAMAPQFRAADFAAVAAVLERLPLAITAVRQLSTGLSISAPATVAGMEWQLAGSLPDVVATAHDLRDQAMAWGMDLALCPAAQHIDVLRLAVFDMDSTLIEAEVIDQLAIAAGVGARVAAITERAMRGELDFKASFTERLGLLAGLDASVLAGIAARLPITPGAQTLLAELRARGVRTAIVSGGFHCFAEYLQSRLAIDEIHANALEIVDGQVTGRVQGPIMDGTGKAQTLLALTEQRGLRPAQVLAVGDGANDLPMLAAAGIGVAFRAKPLVRAQAALALDVAGLDGVLYLLGLAENERRIGA